MVNVTNRANVAVRLVAVEFLFGHRRSTLLAASAAFTIQTLERVKGIEPSYSAWKAAALPLSYTRPETVVRTPKPFWRPAPSKWWGR
jgi:hypothetical protein